MESSDVASASSIDPVIRQILSRHPRVGAVDPDATVGLHFGQGDWSREVVIGDPSEEIYGLVEIMDNNPMVCADRVSVTGPAATLALIALAPLAEAGLIEDSPAIVFNFDTDSSELDLALKTTGWGEGAAVHCEPWDIDGVLAATVLVSIRTPDDLEDIDALFEERYGRSFYVRRDETSDWGSGVVLGKPYAVYRLRIAPDQPNSLLTVRVLADRDGKCGAAQVVHAMNVMCGFEESLGIS